jgi:hypothetical protein
MLCDVMCLALPQDMDGFRYGLFPPVASRLATAALALMYRNALVSALPQDHGRHQRWPAVRNCWRAARTTSKINQQKLMLPSNVSCLALPQDHGRIQVSVASGWQQQLLL